MYVYVKLYIEPNITSTTVVVSVVLELLVKICMQNRRQFLCAKFTFCLYLEGLSLGRQYIELSVISNGIYVYLFALLTQ